MEQTEELYPGAAQAELAAKAVIQALGKDAGPEITITMPRAQWEMMIFEIDKGKDKIEKPGMKIVQGILGADAVNKIMAAITQSRKWRYVDGEGWRGAN